MFQLSMLTYPFPVYAIMPFFLAVQNKCFPYWPQPEDPPMEQGKYQIEYVAHEEEAAYRLSHLKLENLEVCGGRGGAEVDFLGVGGMNVA